MWLNYPELRVTCNLRRKSFWVAYQTMLATFFFFLIFSFSRNKNFNFVRWGKLWSTEKHTYTLLVLEFYGTRILPPLTSHLFYKWPDLHFLGAASFPRKQIKSTASHKALLHKLNQPLIWNESQPRTKDEAEQWKVYPWPWDRFHSKARCTAVTCFTAGSHLLSV